MTRTKKASKVAKQAVRDAATGFFALPRFGRADKYVDSGSTHDWHRAVLGYLDMVPSDDYRHNDNVIYHCMKKSILERYGVESPFDSEADESCGCDYCETREAKKEEPKPNEVCSAPLEDSISEGEPTAVSSEIIRTD